MCDYSCARGGMAGTVCMYGWHWFVVTGATGQRAGPGTPNDRRPEETLTTCALLAPATPVLSMRVDGILPWPWLPSPNPLPASSTGPWPHLEVPAVHATSTARYSIPTGTCTYQLTEEKACAQALSAILHAARGRRTFGCCCSHHLPRGGSTPTAAPQRL